MHLGTLTVCGFSKLDSNQNIYIYILVTAGYISVFIHIYITNTCIFTCASSLLLSMFAFGHKWRSHICRIALEPAACVVTKDSRYVPKLGKPVSCVFCLPFIWACTVWRVPGLLTKGRPQFVWYPFPDMRIVFREVSGPEVSAMAFERRSQHGCVSNRTFFQG